MKILTIIFLMHIGVQVYSQTITFTTQAKVDSFVAVMDTSRIYGLVFFNDKDVQQSKSITDLSGFNIFRNVGVKIIGYEWVDIPWFTNNVNGGFELIDMPFLRTINGVKDYEGSFEIDNCPSLNSYPPKGALKYCNTVIIKNITKDNLTIDLSEVLKNPRSASWSNRMYVYNNNIKKLIVVDPNAAAQELIIKYDSTMTYFEYQGDSTLLLELVGNSELTDVRGFIGTTFIAPYNSISYNPKLSDVCAMRKGLDAYYQSLQPRDKPNFNNYGLVANGFGASSYQEMMAADCEWLKHVSVKENDIKKGALSVFPNPANDRFTVKLNCENTSGIAKLYNLQGAVVLQKHVETSEFNFYTSALPRGIYLLEYISQNGESAKVKIVLQ